MPPQAVHRARSCGHLALPFKTINKGVTVVADSGTVHVAVGTYAESFTISKSLTLKGAQYGVAVAAGTAASASEATIQGLVTWVPTTL